MDVSFQRKVDRIVGTVACRLLSWLPRARRQPPPSFKPKKILVILLSEMGALVLAPGAELFDPSVMTRHGYGRLENVLTNLDFERVVCASGPTQGRLIRPDGKKIERLAFIQCVGSRDSHYHEYCSSFCCMATLKQALLVKEHHPESEVFVFYNDII